MILQIKYLLNNKKKKNCFIIENKTNSNGHKVKKTKQNNKLISVNFFAKTDKGVYFALNQTKCVRYR